MNIDETPRQFLRAFLTACANGINPVDAFEIGDLTRFTQIDLLLEFVSVAMGLTSMAGVAMKQSDHEVLTKLYELLGGDEPGVE